MPSKSDINPDTGKPYAVNPATGAWDDNYFAQVVEPQLRNIYSDPVSDLLNPIIDKYTQQLENYQKKYKEYNEKNPFVFDTVLAEEKKKVGQRLDPYYEQTLSDYLKGVETKRSRSIEDERRVLGELQQDTDQFVGREKNRLLDAIERSREGYSDAGLYSSGKRFREQGQLEANTNETLSDALTQKNRKEQDVATGRKRLEEDLTLDEKLKRRDLEKEKTYQTEMQSYTETQRRQQQNEFERQQYAGAIPGVDTGQLGTSLYKLLPGLS